MKEKHLLNKNIILIADKASVPTKFDTKIPSTNMYEDKTTFMITVGITNFISLTKLKFWFKGLVVKPPILIFHCLFATIIIVKYIVTI